MSETNKKLILLLQCTRRRCGHVLLESDQVWEPNDGGGKTATCPRCGREEFFTLDAQGRCLTMRHTGPKEIYAEDIEPGPRMGRTMRRRLLAVKARALGTNNTDATQGVPTN